MINQIRNYDSINSSHRKTVFCFVKNCSPVISFTSHVSTTNFLDIVVTIGPIGLTTFVHCKLQTLTAFYCTLPPTPDGVRTLFLFLSFIGCYVCMLRVVISMIKLTKYSIFSVSWGIQYMFSLRIGTASAIYHGNKT